MTLTFKAYPHSYYSLEAEWTAFLDHISLLSLMCPDYIPGSILGAEEIAVPQ